MSLYIKNYNLETLNPNSTVNPITSLICTILLEIASMERLTIKERMTSGRKQYIERCRRDGVKMGRPASYKKDVESYKSQYQREIGLLRKGVSLRNISAITGTAVNTVRKVKEMFIESELQPVSNVHPTYSIVFSKSDGCIRRKYWFPDSSND